MTEKENLNEYLSYVRAYESSNPEIKNVYLEEVENGKKFSDEELEEEKYVDLISYTSFSSYIDIIYAIAKTIKTADLDAELLAELKTFCTDYDIDLFNDNPESSENKADVSVVAVKAEIQRLHEEITELEKQHPNFRNLYLHELDVGKEIAPSSLEQGGKVDPVLFGQYRDKVNMLKSYCTEQKENRTDVSFAQFMEDFWKSYGISDIPSVVNVGTYSDCVVSSKSVICIEGAKKASTSTPQKSTENNNTSETLIQPPAQILENLPAELLNQKRFFPTRCYFDNHKKKWAKKPSIDDWSNPDNQKFYRDVTLYNKAFLGFDISGHKLTDDYLCVDFDNCFNDKGEFVSEEIARWVNLFFDDNGNAVTYAEKSISGRGLHLLFKPANPDDFKEYVGKGNKLPVKGGCEIEVFYKQESRFIQFTGILYHCAAGAQISTECDDVLFILNQIDNLAPSITSSSNQIVFSTKYDDPQEFIIDCARDCLKLIPPAEVVEQGGDSGWLAVITACKNLNIPYSIVDEWNKQDSLRYDSKENWRRWKSKLNPDPNKFGLGTLIGKAKALGGFNPIQYKRDWYIQHEEFSVPSFSAIDDFDSWVDDTTVAPTKDIPAALVLSPEMRTKLFREIKGDNDVANSERIVSFFDNVIRYLTDEDKWLIFNGHFWDIRSNANISALYTYAVKLGTVLRVNAKTSVEKKIAKAFTQRSKLSPAIDLIKGVDRACITQKDLNTYPNLLNLQNGVIDLESKKFYSCRDSSINIPSLYITQMINADYRAGYRNEFVINVLKSILPEEDTRAAFLRYLGYCLTGEVIEEKAVFLRGGGGNGKGTITRTLLHLFGTYGTTFPIGVLLAHRFEPDAEAATPALASLLFTRLALCEEIPQGQRLDAAKFKQLTGGDAIYYRQLHERGKVIDKPSHKFIISGNYDTELQDSHDDGIKRRVIYVPFTQKYSDDNRDEQLKQKLTTPDSLAGLLSLLVDNAAEWYKHGLFESPSMQSFKRQFFDSQDFIADFIDENCIFKPDGRILLKDIVNKVYDYPSTPRGLSVTSLREMIKRFFAERAEVTEIKDHHRIMFKGIAFDDSSTTQQTLADFDNLDTAQSSAINTNLDIDDLDL